MMAQTSNLPDATGALVSEPTQGTAQEASYLEARRLYGPSLVRLVRGYETQPARQQDLLQEIHVALWRSFALFDRRCSLRTWVYRIAHNTAARHVRSNRRLRLREQYSLDEIADPVDSNDGLDVTDNADALRRLFELIALLKPLDRQIILLYLEDLSAESIADVVGLSVGNVTTKVHRIKKLLGSMFSDGEKS